MIPETASSTVLRFGAFELDLNEAQVRKSGVALKLRPQAFRVLTLLAGRTGHLVTREDIQKEIWSDDTVADFEQGLNVCIRQIRAVLGDEADSPDSSRRSRGTATGSWFRWRVTAHPRRSQRRRPPEESGRG